MPTLNWIGKEAVVEHHRRVPTRLLECDPELSVGDPNAENLLVEGDNLEALKALLPRYRGQVKCIYIDPPYNTGNEEWKYNDNVNDPRIRKWLGDVVGKEAEDLCRHDKWLCMMYPRLALLKEFLKQDGVILISIDDFEIHHLKCLMNELFGVTNFIAQLVWDKTRKNDAKLFSVGHEYLLVYAKSLSWLKQQGTVWREQKQGAAEIAARWKELVATYADDHNEIQKALRLWYRSLSKNHPSKKLSRYKWVDKYGPWRDRDISWPGGGGPRYEVPHPVTQMPCKIPDDGWRFATKKEMDRQIDLKLVVFREDHTKPPFRKAHLLPLPSELSMSVEEDENESIDADDSDDAIAGLQVMPSLIQKQAQVAVKTLKRMFDGEKVFENPKDHEVIARLIRYVAGPSDIILDSFAGSGTTGHAVMALNQADCGNRQCVLVEIDPPIARNVTTKRLSRAIEQISLSETGGGQDGSSAATLGFRYCRLGRTLLDQNGNINGDVPFADLARYVFLLETGVPIPKRPRKDYALLGVHRGQAIYLLYNGVLGDRRPAGGNVLTTRVLAELPEHPERKGPRVIYGEACRLGEATLARENVTFRQVPYSLREGT